MWDNATFSHFGVQIICARFINNLNAALYDCYFKIRGFFFLLLRTRPTNATAISKNKIGENRQLKIGKSCK